LAQSKSDPFKCFQYLNSAGRRP